MRAAFALLIAFAAALPAAAATPPAATDCLITRSITQTTVGPDKHYYVRTMGRQWWRNTMECPVLAAGRAVVHTSPIGKQCKGDIVQVVDFALGGINFGGCGFGNWEPVDGPPKDAPKK